jgi:hypothetical protein
MWTTESTPFLREKSAFLTVWWICIVASQVKDGIFGFQQSEWRVFCISLQCRTAIVMPASHITRPRLFWFWKIPYGKLQMNRRLTQANALVSEEQRKGIFIPCHSKFLFICCFIESLYCHRSHGWLMLGALDYQHRSSVIFACSKYLQQLLKPAKTCYLKHSLFGFWSLVWLLVQRQKQQHGEVNHLSNPQ